MPHEPYFHSCGCGVRARTRDGRGGRRPARRQEQHPGEYSPADIETGARLYGAQCSTCHALTGDGVGGIDLRRGTFRRVSSDEDLRHTITGGVPGTAMPKFDVTPAEQNALVAYIRAGFEVGGRAVKIGDIARGKAVYDKGGCASCHRAAGVGSRKAPDLTDIGTLRSASMLQQSITEPTAYPAADQPAGPGGDQRRQGHQRPPPQRRHLHRATDR